MIRLLFGAFLAGSLDLAVGVFAVIITSQLWHKPLTLPILCFGMFLAVLPDFDLLLEILKNKKSSGEHKKSFFHIPLFFLPLVCLPLWVISGYLATIALIGLLWHYWHDLTEKGPGLPFTPISRERFLLQVSFNKKLKISWIIPPEQLKKFYAETFPEWVEREYLQFKAKPIIGLSAFIGSLTIFAIKYF